MHLFPRTRNFKLEFQISFSPWHVEFLMEHQRNFIWRQILLFLAWKIPGDY